MKFCQEADEHREASGRCCHSLFSFVALVQRGVLFVKGLDREQELHTPLYHYGSVLDIKVSDKDLVGLSTGH